MNLSPKHVDMAPEDILVMNTRVVLGWWMDLMTLKAFSDLNDSVID